MSILNLIHNQNVKVLAKEECYNDNEGAYSLAYLLNDNEVIVEKYAHSRDNLHHNDVKVNASKEEIQLGAEILAVQNAKKGNYKNLVDCVVVLHRSRKAPNKIPLNVLGEISSHYNEYNRFIPDQIIVDVNGVHEIVSKSCVKEVIRGELPFWASWTLKNLKGNYLLL